MLKLKREPYFQLTKLKLYALRKKKLKWKYDGGACVKILMLVTLGHDILIFMSGIG